MISKHPYSYLFHLESSFHHCIAWKVSSSQDPAFSSEAGQLVLECGVFLTQLERGKVAEDFYAEFYAVADTDVFCINCLLHKIGKGG